MTKITAFDLQPLFRQTVGVDRLFDRIMNQIDSAGHQPNNNYPPYNSIQTGEHTYKIEVAVAGFNEGEISVEVRDGDLIITGEKLEEEAVETDEHYHVIHKGISARKFFKSFQMGEYVEVVDASVVNGILTVNLERKIPESAKPKAIAITYKN